MKGLVTDPRRESDVDQLAADLAAGRWLVRPYETYGQVDRAEWNTEFVAFVAERQIRAGVIDIPKKSVVIVFNVDAQPTFEQVTESVAAIDHQRAMGRP